MNVKNIYDTVTLNCLSSQNTFLTHLDTTVRSLIARFGTACVVETGNTYTKPVSVNDDIPVYDAYFPAVCDNLQFLIASDSDRKTDFLNEAQDAYRTVWSAKMKNKRIVGYQ